MRSAAAAALLAMACAARGGNLAPASGVYAATLGAGAATGAERSAFGQNPAALRPGTAGFRADYHRPYGLDELEVAEAGAYFDRGRLGAACDWRATSITDAYSEQGFRGAAAWRVSGRHGFPGALDAGYGLTAWRAAFAGGGPWRPWRDAPGRLLGFGLEADSRSPGASGIPDAPSQILRLDFRKNGDGSWRAIASLSAHPLPALEASLGLAAHPFQAAAGLSLAWRGIRVRQAARYHRYLGRTLLAGLDFAR